MDTSRTSVFCKIIWNYYEHHGRRDLLWRIPESNGSFNPYKIMVSEIMLQQTQVSRVTPKFVAFLKAFPTLQELACAPLSEVLIQWNGLGYNRRAKFLWQAAAMLVSDYGGQFPETVEELQTLPGIGKNTAGAIAAYAFNKPVIYVETNVRTVYIHHFFHDRKDVADKEILELLEQTVDQDNAREFYWALMDYGTYLKQTVGNLNRRSKSYARQSPLEGSRRQIRGKVIKLLTTREYTLYELQELIHDERLESVLDDLGHEQLLANTEGFYHLA